MKDDSVLKWVLETNFVPGLELNWDGLRKYLEHPDFPERAGKFKNELATAIIHQQITPEEFERVTGVDRDSKEDVADFLKEELWVPLYPNEPVRVTY